MRFMDPGKEFLDALEACHEIKRVDGRIAAIAAFDPVEGRQAGDMMDTAHQARLVATLARTVSGASAVGRPAIEGYADEGDIDLLGLGDGQAHEGRKAGKARHKA